MKSWLLLIFAAALSAGCLTAQDAERFFYSKSFPGSTPAYTQVTVEKSGEVEYKEAPDDELPLKYKLTDAETAEVFALVAKLDYFSRPLESGLKVAFMGKKTFRAEGGSRKGEQQFNYSEDADAKVLWDWCERLTESAQHRIELDRAAKYDKLGVFKALSLLGSAIERKRVVGLEQYLPTLDRIIKNESYMHTARTRASEIAEFIRSGAGPTR
jgi:hypothetical protein